MSIAAVLITAFILAPIAAFGSLSVVDPELAFGIENIVQLRRSN